MKRTATAPSKRLVVAITGASGAVYGLRLLELLREQRDWESHLVISDAGALNLWQEKRMRRREVEALADQSYRPADIGAAIASGSFLAEGMVIAPCSMRALAAVAHAHANDLVSRAADVALKERRRLVLVTREAPLNLAHLRNMVAATEMGAVVFPPAPAHYARPRTLDDLVSHVAARVLDLFGIHSDRIVRWEGMKAAGRPRV